jgi:predicted alpha/beta-fold hydrolase
MTNGHVQTIFASLFRVVTGVRYTRKRIDTRDGDFLDLDFSEVSDGPIAILVHGLEGSSAQGYMLGMARALNARGINVVSVNLRGCSGEVNRHLSSYDMSSTGDLLEVTKCLSAMYPNRVQYLVGFSLGGNLILKFLGEQGDRLSPHIQKAVAFSVPCDLRSTAGLITASSNRLYYYRFMRSVQAKLKEKDRLYPGQINPKALEWANSFKQLDDYFTAPNLGLASAEQYWDSASSKHFLAQIRVPTLLVNAKDDPLISGECFPVDIARRSTFFHLEVPSHGGHVGFVAFNSEGEYWSEKRALTFIIDGK